MGQQVELEVVTSDGPLSMAGPVSMAGQLEARTLNVERPTRLWYILCLFSVLRPQFYLNYLQQVTPEA